MLCNDAELNTSATFPMPPQHHHIQVSCALVLPMVSLALDTLEARPENELVIEQFLETLYLVCYGVELLLTMNGDMIALLTALYKPLVVPLWLNHTRLP